MRSIYWLSLAVLLLGGGTALAHGGMGSGYGCGYMGMGPMMMSHGPCWGSQTRSTSLSKEEAQALVANYVLATGNPNLKVGKISETKESFEVQVVTAKENALVEKVLVDKDTGWMRSTH